MGVPYTNLNINHKKELRWGLWVGSRIGTYSKVGSGSSRKILTLDPRIPSSQILNSVLLDLGLRAYTLNLKPVLSLEPTTLTFSGFLPVISWDKSEGRVKALRHRVEGFGFMVC